MASIYESFFNTESLNERAPHFKGYKEGPSCERPMARANAKSRIGIKV